MNPFNYFYDFVSCIQPITGDPITYVVGTYDAVVSGIFKLQSISNPYQSFCGTLVTGSTSTAATHTLLSEYADCDTCLSANTVLINVSDMLKPSVTYPLIADIKYKKGDIINIDVVYDDADTLKFIKTAGLITGISPYTGGTFINDIIFYTKYDSAKQVVESKGVYYSSKDCKDGEQTIFLSHTYIESYGKVVNLPYGSSNCKTVSDILTSGLYSEVSGQTPVLYSSKIFDNCDTCLNNSTSDEINESFNSSIIESNSINVINQLSDGSILIGGSGFTHVSGGTLYNVGNIVKLTPSGELFVDFNSNDGGSLSLYNNNFIYTNYSSNFNFESDFTIEFWLNFVSPNLSDPSIISFYDYSESLGWEIGFTNYNQIRFKYNSTEEIFETRLGINSWIHLAIVRNSGVLNLYVNGEQDLNSDIILSDDIIASEGTLLYIGSNSYRDSFVDGYITNIRICQSSVYSGEFIPQTTPLTKSQNSFENISSIESSATTLLLNFTSLSNLLQDSSLYSNTFISYKPSVSYLAYTPVKPDNLSYIYDSTPLNDFVQLDLPDGYTLDAFGIKISTVYIGTNSYLTFEQGSDAGGIVLPTDIPSQIDSTGLFISTLGNNFDSDNETYIRKISTGFTENGEKLVVKVEGGYKSLLCTCKCFSVRNNSTGDITVEYTPCTTDDDCDTGLLTELVIFQLNEYHICAQSIDIVGNPDGFVSIEVIGNCSQFNPSLTVTDWVCGLSCGNGNLVQNPEFRTAPPLGSNTIPSWSVVNSQGQQNQFGWAWDNSTDFGPSAVWTGGSGATFLQQECLVNGATYAISFDLKIEIDFDTCPSLIYNNQNPYVKVYAGTNSSDIINISGINSLGGQERVTVELVSFGTELKFRAYEQCSSLIPIYISNICVREVAPPPNCQCYEVRHTNGPNAPNYEWFVFRWRDCTNEIQQAQVGPGGSIFPCVRDNWWEIANGEFNAEYAEVVTQGTSCVNDSTPYCVDPVPTGCKCYEVKIGFNNYVEFLDCDGNYRTIVNNISPSVTISGRICMTQILFGFNSITYIGNCTSQCATFPDPIPPIDGCGILFNSASDTFDLYLYDITTNTAQNFIPQNAYIFDNVNSSLPAYTDIAISQTANRLYFSNAGTYEDSTPPVIVEPYPATIIGYFDIDFSAGTYTAGASINITPEPPFWNGQGSVQSNNQGLEVSLDGQYVYLSSYYYSENPDVQSIIICQIVTVDSNQTTPVFMSCTKLFDLLPGRRVQGDIVRTNTNKLLITTTDGQRVFVEQWYTDDTAIGSIFEFEVVLKFATTGGNYQYLTPGEFQIDLFIYEEQLYVSDNNQTPTRIYAVNSEYPYDLLLEEDFPNEDRLNGAASFPECNKFEFIYPDPRCRPLIIFSGGSLQNPIEVSRYHFLPYQTPPLLDLGTYPSEIYTYSNFEIAHIFNFDTNTGKMWILGRSANVSQGRFFEWDITGVPQVNGEISFEVEYQRYIDLNIIGSGYRIFNGFTVVDDSTFIIGSTSASTVNGATVLTGFVLQVDIPSPTGNLNLTFSNVTVMFRLPIPGDEFYTENFRLLPTSDLMYTVDNKLIIVTAKVNTQPTSNTRILLQYPYFIDALFDTITNIENTDSGNMTPINYNGRILIGRRIAFSPQNWDAYTVGITIPFQVGDYNDVSNNLSFPSGRVFKGSSSINFNYSLFPTQCNLVRLIPNVPTQIPEEIVGCTVMLNSTSYEGLWVYSVDNNQSEPIILPQYGPIGNTVFSYSDIATSNVTNRLFGKRNPGGVVFWEIDFASGTFISGPFEIGIPLPVLWDSIGFGEGMETTIDGLGIYLSTDPIPLNTPQSIILYTPVTTLDNFGVELITLELGSRVKGDIVRTTNNKLFLSITDGTSIFIQQWTCDDTQVGTFLDGEFEFGPDIYDHFDIFLDNNNNFYATAVIGDTTSLYQISVDLNITQIYTDINLGRVRGAAAHPTCHTFEFEFPNPACRPLFLYSGAPYNGGDSSWIVGRFNFTNNQPDNFDLVNLTAGGPYPGFSLVNTGVRNGLNWADLTHTYDFNTDTGRLWIKFRPGNSQINFLIYEFDILNSDFDCSYNRTISITGTTTSRLGAGVTYISDNILMSSRNNGPWNNNTTADLVLVDITTNNPGPVSSFPLFVSLPLLNTVGNTNRNLLVNSGLQFMANDKIVVCTKQGIGFESAWTKYILQYSFTTGTLELVINAGATGVDQGVLSYFGEVFNWKRAGNVSANQALAARGLTLTTPFTPYTWTPFSFNSGTIQPVIGGFIGQDSSSPAPDPLAVSVCNLVSFVSPIVNVPILGPCPVFFITNNLFNPDLGNKIFSYDVDTNTSLEIILPNIPTGSFFEIAYSNVSDRLYLLHGSFNSQSLTYWNVNFETGVASTDTVTIPMTPPLPPPGGSLNLSRIGQGLCTSLDGLSVYFTNSQLISSTNIIDTLFVFNTTTNTITQVLQLPFGRIMSGDFLITNNGKFLVSLRDLNTSFTSYIRQYSLDPSGLSMEFEIEHLLFASGGLSLDLFMDNSNQLYIFASPPFGGTVPNLSLVFNISIYGQLQEITDDTNIGRIHGAAGSPNCYTFNFQSLCDSLMLWLAPQNQAHRLRVSRYRLDDNIPVFIDLGTSYNSTALGTTLIETFDIAHSFDFITNTGFLWIKKVTGTNTTIINEWTIDDEFYNVTWNRLISLNTSNNGGQITRIDQGMAYISENVLVMGAVVGGTPWTPTSSSKGLILRVNITNNNITFNECSVFFILPIEGDTNYNGTGNLLVFSSLYYAENSLVITAKPGNTTLTESSPNYVLQYDYEQDAQPSLIQELTTNYTQPSAVFPMTYEGNVYLVRNQSTNWGLQELIAGPPFGINTVFSSIPLPPSITGPHGVSSVNPSESSEQLCEPVGLVVNLCNLCNFDFDFLQDYGLGIINVGNLISSCQNNVTNYVINWYGPNSTTEVAFTSGLGNQFTYDYQHPLTGNQSPIVLSGEYIPVIDKVIIGGITYSNTPSPNTVVTDLDCLPTINVICANCVNSNSTDPDYSYEFSFSGATQGSITPPFQTCLDLPSTVNYIACKFRGFTAFDNLKVKYIGANYSDPLILVNVNVGQNSVNSGWLNDTLFLNNYPFTSFLKKVINLGGINRSLGNEQIIFEVSSVNTGTEWELYYECLDNFDCENCIFEEGTGDEYKLDSSTLEVTTTDTFNFPVPFSSSCFTNVRIDMVPCENFGDSDAFKYLVGETSDNVTFNCNHTVGDLFNGLIFFTSLNFDGSQRIYSQNFTIMPTSLSCASVNNSNTITYDVQSYPGGYSIIISSNIPQPITNMYQSYLNLMTSSTMWGASGCTDGLPSYYEGQSNGHFSGGTSQNGLPSYNDPEDFRYYRTFRLFIPSATGVTSCGGVADNGQGGFQSNHSLNSHYFDLHSSAQVSTGSSNNALFQLTINQSIVDVNEDIFECIAYPYNALSQITILNNYINSVVSFNATSQTGSYFQNAFRARSVSRMECDVDTSTAIRYGEVDWSDWVVNTVPFDENGNSLTELSAQTCSYIGYIEGAQVNRLRRNTFYYRIQLLNDSTTDFEIYATPIVNSVITPPEVLALTYEGGVITYTNPDYVV